MKTSARAPHGVRLAAALLLLAAAVAWHSSRGSETSRPRFSRERASSLERGEASGAEAPATGARILASRGSPPPTAPEIAADGVPIMGAGDGDSSADGPRHPHPLTPAHQRIFRENALLGQLNGAVDVADAAALRRLTAAYAAEYPEDEQELTPGYELIADCLTGRTEATRARAERYFAAERGSILRRYVQRHCLN